MVKTVVIRAFPFVIAAPCLLTSTRLKPVTYTAVVLDELAFTPSAKRRIGDMNSPQWLTNLGLQNLLPDFQEAQSKTSSSHP